MRSENLWRLKEVRKSLENRRNQIFLLDIDSSENKWNQIWVLLENFHSVSSLSQVVNSDNSETFERRVLGLQISLDDWVQLIVVCSDVAGREIFDHDTEEHHGELLL